MRHTFAIPHVLHLINGFSDGGTERQAIQLANALSDSGHWRVSVASLSADGPLRELLSPDLRERVVSFPLRRLFSAHTLTQVADFRRFVVGNGVDILHTHGFYPNLFGIAGALRSGVPVRIASKRESVALRSPARALAERNIFRLATHIVANCHAVRRELIASGVRGEQITTIYNALDVDRRSSMTDPAARLVDVCGLDAAGPCVAVVANFHHEAKDHATILRAARRVVDQEKDIHFILAGEGPHRVEVHRRALDLGLDGAVHLPGRCHDVPALLRHCLVGALSSRLEGFPNAVLEYMAAGRPVVATNVGGVGEAIENGDTGYLVAAGDDASMAAYLLRLLRDAELRERMGQAARGRVLSEYTLARQLEGISSLYWRELVRAAAIRA